MKSCDYLHSSTREPKVFYKSDGGVVYSTLLDAMKNSNRTVQVGFKDGTGDFISRATIPATGDTNTYIKNEYLKPVQNPDGSFESVDEIAGDILEESLILQDINGYEREGNKFWFGDFKLKPEDLQSKENKSLLLTTDFLSNKRNERKDSSVKYSDTELKTLIQDTLLKMGFSIEVVKNLEHRGVKPQAMVQFSERLVRFSEGQDTLENLSEEFAHVLVESLDRNMIDRMLGVVNNTQEYAKHSEQYRQLYSRQISNPQLLEKAVRKEVLGKMLSEALRSEFSSESRNNTEKGLFSKLMELLQNFLRYIAGNITTDIKADVRDLARDVLNAMERDTLLQRLDPMTDVTVDVLYSAYSADPIKFRNFVNEINRYGGVIDDRHVKEIHDLMSSALVVSEAVVTNIKTAQAEGKVVDNNTFNSVQRLVDLRDHVSIINEKVQSITPENYKNFYGKSEDSINSFKRSVLDKTQAFERNMSIIVGNMSSVNQSSQEVLRELEEVLEKNNLWLGAEDRYSANSDFQYAVNKEQLDTSWFWKYFGHISKSSNLFVSVGGAITGKMRDRYLALMDRGINKFVKPLEPLKDKLSNVFKNGRFRNGIDESGIQEDMNRHRWRMIELATNGEGYEYHPDREPIRTYEEYLKALDDPLFKPEIENPSVYYAFYIFDKYYSTEKKWLGEHERNKGREWVESLQAFLGDYHKGDLLILSGNPFVRDLIDSNTKNIDIRTRREKQSPFESSGSLKKGILLMTKKEYLTSYSRLTAVSDNPNLDIEDLNDDDLVFVYDLYDEEADVDAVITIKYMQWNRHLKKYTRDRSNRDQMLSNFEKAYREQVEKLDRKGVSTDERRKLLKKWLTDNSLFDHTEDYWEGLPKDNGIRIPELLEFLKNGNRTYEYNRVLKIQEEIQKKSIQKKFLFKKFKDSLDYKEVDINAITSVDKTAILSIEREISSLRQELYPIFKEVGLQPYDNINNVNVRFNKSLRDRFTATVGVDFRQADIEQLEKFFLSGDNVKMSANEYSRYKQNIKTGSMDADFIEFAKAQGFNTRDVTDMTRALFLYKANSWLLRYDSGNSYDILLEMLDQNSLDIEKAMNSFFSNPNSNFIFYDSEGKKRELDFMVLSPSFKFTETFKPDKKLLLEKYQETSDRKVKQEILDQLTEADIIDSVYKEDVSDIFRDPETTEAYWMSWDMQIERLSHDFSDESTISRRHISILPQVRRTRYERMHDIFRGRFDVKSVKDWALEEWSFREDDFENAYKDRLVPRYGYVLLENEERSSDYYHSLVWGLKNAYTRSSRVKYLPHIQKALRGIESQHFKNGKDPKSTNYYQMLSEHIDSAYYGKTQSFQQKMTIPLSKWGMGKDVTFDLGKMLLWFRNFSVKMALQYSPLTAINNFLGGVMQNTIMSFTEHDIYRKANLRATGIMGAGLASPVGDIGSFDPKAKLNKLLYQFGYHDLEERYQDARYNKFLRTLDELGFGFMAMTNYPLEVQVLVSKLAEYRLIDGGFLDWKSYRYLSKKKNPELSNSEIKANFDKYEKLSMYDMLDTDTWAPDYNKAVENGYRGTEEAFESLKDQIRASIRDITERTTMEIRDINQAEGLRNPIASFFTSMKKWMILVTSNMLSKERYSYDSMSFEKGQLTTISDLPRILASGLTNTKEMAKRYNELSDIDKINLKRTAITGALLATAFAVAYLLKGAADDDDERDNYMLQLAALIAIRNLNELSTSQIGIGQAYFESIQSPIMAVDTLKSIPKIFNFGNIGDEVSTGKYKGMDKWTSDVIKSTYLKNLYNVGIISGGDYSRSEVLYMTRNSFLHFNTNESLYSVLSLLPDKPKEE